MEYQPVSTGTLDCGRPSMTCLWSVIYMAVKEYGDVIGLENIHSISDLILLVMCDYCYSFM
jgi:hypothetical protein